MIEPIFLAILIAKIKKYKIKPLLKTWVIYPVLLSTVIYIFLEVMIFQENYLVLRYSGIISKLFLVPYAIIVIVYSQYASIFIGSACVLAGTALNNIAMRANNWKMPIFPSLSIQTGYIKAGTFNKSVLYDNVHVLGGHSTKLVFLTDIIDTGYTIMSVGDLLIRLFPFFAIYFLIKDINNQIKVNRKLGADR